MALVSKIHLLPMLAAVSALAGCGGSDSNRASTTTATTALPALATRPATTGEIVLRANASPNTHGPHTFNGRYLVRFEQYAPEDPKLDFSTQTPFQAALLPHRDDPRGAIKLIEGATRIGQRTLTIHGRYFIDVSFGDFPYVLRFTPHGAGGRADGRSRSAS
jgi:hypothetical protein